MNLRLHVWRQLSRGGHGAFVTYEATGILPEMSFLEMLDVVNEGLLEKGELPIAFDHDCREGICGSCGFMINGLAHGPRSRTTVCQLHMRSFEDGAELTLEPFRANSFPLVRDLIVDRSALDAIIQAGGYISAPIGGAPDGNAIPIRKENADLAMDAAACIGCGACVASCSNSSAMLFTAAKVSQLALLPQGQPERYERVLKMVATMDARTFGSCTNQGECEAACPKGVRLSNIARLNRDYIAASLLAGRREEGGFSGD